MHRHTSLLPLQQQKKIYGETEGKGRLEFIIKIYRSEED